MAEVYYYRIKFIPDEKDNPTGEYLRFDGHSEVEEIMESKTPQEIKDNSHLATLPSLHPYRTRPYRKSYVG